MSSPFPGMDPYIEEREIWMDFHGNLAPEIQGRLNQFILPKYFASLTPHVTYDVVGVMQTRRKAIQPDVGIWQSKPSKGETVVAMPSITPATVESRISLEVPLRLLSVEIHATDTMELVTAIEILSPVNKRPSHDAYKKYQSKRRELLNSDAHLLEIDLLRGGTRPPLEDPVPEAPYYVTLSRADNRPSVEVWAIQLPDTLPVLPVPLQYPDADVPFDLKGAISAVYERGGYAARIDYQQPPPPPKLGEKEDRWLDEHLHFQGVR